MEVQGSGATDVGAEIDEANLVLQIRIAMQAYYERAGPRNFYYVQTESSATRSIPC